MQIAKLGRAGMKFGLVSARDDHSADALAAALRAAGHFVAIDRDDRAEAVIVVHNSVDKFTAGEALRLKNRAASATVVAALLDDYIWGSTHRKLRIPEWLRLKHLRRATALFEVFFVPHHAWRRALRIGWPPERTLPVESLESVASISEDLVAALRRAGDRFHSVLFLLRHEIPLVAEVTGYSIAEVESRLLKEWRQPGTSVAEGWNERQPVSRQQIEAFYRETNSYIFDLLIAHQSWEHHMRVQRASRVLREADCRSVLDFGCGAGDDAIDLARNGFTVTMYDVPSFTLKFASGRTQQSHLPIQVTTEIESLQQFDGVYCADVLEHVVDPPATLQQISSKLRAGGVAAITHCFELIGEHHPSHLASNRARAASFDQDAAKAGLRRINTIALPGNTLHVFRKIV